MIFLTLVFLFAVLPPPWHLLPAGLARYVRLTGGNGEHDLGDGADSAQAQKKSPHGVPSKTQGKFGGVSAGLFGPG